jgi:hypothetical protein
MSKKYALIVVHTDQRKFIHQTPHNNDESKGADTPIRQGVYIEEYGDSSPRVSFLFHQS